MILRPTAYYNEIEPFAAQWLRNLIAAGHIVPGDVDERSIADVQPEDLRGYKQCHFFAGIGVWSHALRLVGWPDDRPVWTGSCPCQPFSTAGKGKGTSDPHHLWPEWFRLIRECRPHVLFGEQVGAAIRHGWLDLVSTDLEGVGYAIGAAVVGAHSVGAPHIRQRLYFVADADSERRTGQRLLLRTKASGRDEGGIPETSRGGKIGELADASVEGRQERANIGGGAGAASEQGERQQQLTGHGAASDVEHAEFEGLEGQPRHGRNRNEPGRLGENEAGSTASPSATGDVGDSEGGGWSRESIPANGEQALRDTQAVAGFWADAEWIACRDGKARPVEPGTFPLAHGVAARVGRLRAYGNAIVAPQAAEFIRAYLDCQS